MKTLRPARARPGARPSARTRPCRGPRSRNVRRSRIATLKRSSVARVVGGVVSPRAGQRHHREMEIRPDVRPGDRSMVAVDDPARDLAGGMGVERLLGPGLEQAIGGLYRLVREAQDPERDRLHVAGAGLSSAASRSSQPVRPPPMVVCAGRADLPLVVDQKGAGLVRRMANASAVAPGEPGRPSSMITGYGSRLSRA